ncbi:glycosyltransferase family 2 protein [Lacinutrix sp. MEBiC02404]
MGKVTVMIPTYNQEDYIGIAIESVLAQKYTNLEIIIGDDCSTDKTEAVVQKYLYDSRVKYVRHKENLGRVKNYRKLLYDNASGEFVLNLDGDDWLVDPDFIFKAVSLLKENNEMSCVLADRQNYYKALDKFVTYDNKNKPFVKTIMNGNEIFINWFNINFVFSHFGCIYRRDLALKLDFYSKNIISSDFESIGKLFINHQVGYLNLISGVWRSHDTNASHNSNTDGVLANLIKYDSLSNYAQKLDVFKKEELVNWLFQMKTNNLSQDVIYVLQSYKISNISNFLSAIFKYDKKIALSSLAKALKKIINHFMKKNKK